MVGRGEEKSPRTDFRFPRSQTDTLPSFLDRLPVLCHFYFYGKKQRQLHLQDTYSGPQTQSNFSLPTGAEIGRLHGWNQKLLLVKYSHADLVLVAMKYSPSLGVSIDPLRSLSCC